MKVYYDDKCSICRKEIDYYKKLRVRNVEWIGIHKNGKKIDFNKITKESYLKRMHVIDDDKQIKVGVEAFIAIWKKNSKFKYLAMVINFFPIKILAIFAYNIFAHFRYKNLYKPKK